MEKSITIYRWSNWDIEDLISDITMGRLDLYYLKKNYGNPVSAKLIEDQYNKELFDHPVKLEITLSVK